MEADFSFLSTEMADSLNSSLVDVTRFTPDGIGAAGENGSALCIPGTVPGDRVRIAPAQKKHHARLLEILTPSELRRETHCPYLLPEENREICGGCPWGMLNAEAQEELKRALLTDALAAYGLSVPAFEHVRADTLTHYRSKAAFYPLNTDGHWQWALYAAGSHSKVAITACQALPEWMNEAAERIAAFLETTDLSAYDELTHSGLVRSLVMREGLTPDGRHCLVTLSLNAPAAQYTEIFRPLTGMLAPLGVEVVTLNEHTARGNALLGEREISLTPAARIETEIGGSIFEVGATTFLQIHREQMLKLYGYAVSLAEIGRDDTVLDLYCGIGTMTLMSARSARRAVGIDIVGASIDAARSNAARNGVTNADFYAGPVEKVLPSLLVRGLRCEKVIVDPAYKGMHESVPAMLSALKPSRLVYVSCNPKTFARDAKALTGLGFQLSSVRTFDLFPDTAHVETVGLFLKQA